MSPIFFNRYCLNFSHDLCDESRVIRLFLSAPPVYFLVAVMILTGSTAHANEQSQAEPWVIAHRGASADAPENSIAAFQEAWEQDADGIEGDFRLTKDGAVVCIHDETTKRCGNMNLKVSESTLEELKAVDIGSWKNKRYKKERIPTLAAVLATVPEGKRIFIELKAGVEIVEPTRKAIIKSGVKDNQVTIISSKADVVAACRKAMPTIQANWLTSCKVKDGRLNPSLETILQTLEASKATGLGISIDSASLDRTFMHALHHAKRQVHCWTINEAKEALHLRALGIDSITTDKPSFIRSVLESDQD